jgi:hypothetical protein
MDSPYNNIFKLRRRKLEGSGYFPKIVLEDCGLDPNYDGKMYNLGDDEHITLKRKGDEHPNKRIINIYPEGEFNQSLHLESTYYNNEKELYIKSINTELLEQSKGMGTYLFNLLFDYLKVNKLKFNKITLIFFPTIPDPKNPEKRITNDDVKLRGMRFYFNVFSKYADCFPMIGKTTTKRDEQVTEPSKENYERVIRDYEENDRNQMIFEKRK